MVEQTKSSNQTDLISQLRASEERYQAFIHNSSEGIWRFELEKPISIDLPADEQIELIYKYGYLAEANEAMAKMYGLSSPKEILGAHVGDFLIKDDPKNIAYLKAFIESGYNLSGAESHEVDVNGNDKYFLNSLVGMVRNGYVLHAWGTQQDITTQRNTMEALRKSEERLELALRASGMGIWEWNVKSDELVWSAELKKIFGLKANDAITYEKYLSAIHPDDRELMMKTVEEARRTGEPYAVEHRVVWPDASIHWVFGRGQAFMKNGKTVRMIGTSTDVDKRKRAEISLQESEERFRTLADTAPVLIWLSDTENKGTYFNKPWLDFTGRSLKQELGFGWAESVHPDDLARATTYCSTCFDARKEFRMEFRLRRADGAYHWMLDHGIPRYSQDGTFLGYIGSCIDIEETKMSKERNTELEEINHKLQEQRLQLVELNTSKDEFISLASHQLRTPATGVKQYVGMLLEGYVGELTPEQMKMLRTAYESNERELRIIDDLLKVAHIDAGKVTLNKQKIDIVHLIDDIIKEQAEKFANKNQTITFKHTAKHTQAVIDPERIRMVVENIIDNSCKYTPDGKNVYVSLSKTAKHIRLSIRDEGVGISKKDASRLFKKFVRIDNPLSTQVGGTGLGLYWADKIVRLHNGTITIDSELRKGTTFTIEIPRGKS